MISVELAPSSTVIQFSLTHVTYLTLGNHKQLSQMPQTVGSHDLRLVYLC